MEPGWLDPDTLHIDREDLGKLVPHLPEGSALAKARMVLAAGTEYGRAEFTGLTDLEAGSFMDALEKAGLVADPPRPPGAADWLASEPYTPERGADLAQILYDTGLIYMVNAAVLHHHGFALAVMTRPAPGVEGHHQGAGDGADHRVVGLSLHRTGDPDGVWFEEDLTIKARGKLREHGLILQPPAVEGEAEEEGS